MAARKRPRAAKPAPKARPAAIDKARADAVALIARRRREAGASALLDKAERLLTQHWAKADWTARAALIENARWLVRVAGTDGDKGDAACSAANTSPKKESA